MADLFISYSRKDREFVLRLNQALDKRDYDVWVDLEDIPPTADWMEEVRSGIEGADAYVFVISPASIASKICQQELDHAVEHNKRLVPIVCREVDPNTVSEPLRSRNWIFFRESDTFDEGFQQLVDAFNTDLDWLHEHTRLLTRAIEWDKSGRDNSFVLRGSDLRTAEEWQVKAMDKEPKLTQLQIEYIADSRKATTRRQRIMQSAVLFGLAVASILAVYAWLQRNDAIEQRNAAVARQLAAQSDLMRSNENPLLQRSVLLAVESMSRFPTFEGDQALRGGLAVLPDQVSMVSYEGPMADVALYPDGKRLATIASLANVALSSDGKRLATAIGSNAWVRDVGSGDEVARVELETTVMHLGLSSNGEYLATAGNATAGSDNTVRIWEVESGDEVGRVENDIQQDGVLSTDVRAIALSPDGKHVAVTSDFVTEAAEIHQTTRVWELPSGDEVARVEQDRPFEVDLSPDGKRLAITSDKGTRVREIESGNEVGWVEHGRLFDIDLSSDGKRLATAGAGSTARVWDVESGDEITRVEHDAGDVAFDPSGEYLATAGDNAVQVWDVESGDEVARVEQTDWVDDIALSPDGKRLVTAYYSGDDYGDNTVRVWQVESGDGVAHMVHRNAVNGAALSPDGKRLATAIGSNAWVRDVGSGEEITRMEHDAPVTEVTFGPSGEYLATASEDNTVRIWEVESGDEVGRVENDIQQDGVLSTDVRAIALSPDGKHVAVTSEKYVGAGRSGGMRLGFIHQTARVWEVESGDKVAYFPRGSGAGAFSFSSDDERMATTSTEGARVWDVESGDEITRVVHTGTDGVVRAIALSPDGEHMATAGSDDSGAFTARVWDVESGNEITRVEHDDSITEVAFSQGGNYLITASEDKTVRVWEIENGTEVARVEQADWVDDIALSPDGKRLITASRYGTARVWDMSNGDEVARIGHRNAVDDVAFSPTGRRLATASGFNARVWELPSGDELARVEHDVEQDGQIYGLAFSPDGKRLATAANKGARVWEISSSDLVARVGDDDLVREVAFGSGGKRLVTRSLDTVKVWELPSGDEGTRVGDHDHVFDVALSPDSKRLATASNKGARVWEISSSDLVARVGDDDLVRGVAFSPSGEYLASAAGFNVQVWDMSNGDEVARMQHDGSVTEVAFSPSGEYLAAASLDKTVRVWEVESGDEVARKDHDDQVYGVVFSPHGEYLATGSAGSDDTARVWYWRPEDLIHEACSRLTRNLTKDEWELYLPNEPPRKTCLKLPEPA